MEQQPGWPQLWSRQFTESCSVLVAAAYPGCMLHGSAQSMNVHRALH